MIYWCKERKHLASLLGVQSADRLKFCTLGKLKELITSLPPEATDDCFVFTETLGRTQDIVIARLVTWGESNAINGVKEPFTDNVCAIDLGSETIMVFNEL